MFPLRHLWPLCAGLLLAGNGFACWSQAPAARPAVLQPGRDHRGTAHGPALSARLRVAGAAWVVTLHVARAEGRWPQWRWHLELGPDRAPGAAERLR